MLLKTVRYFQLGVWPRRLLSGSGETEHFSKKVRRGLESLKHCLQFTAECSGNGKCRQLFAFPACGIGRLLFHSVWSSLISIPLIILQLAAQLLEQETCHPVCRDCGSPSHSQDALSSQPCRFWFGEWQSPLSWAYITRESHGALSSKQYYVE